MKLDQIYRKGKIVGYIDPNRCDYLLIFDLGRRSDPGDPAELADLMKGWINAPLSDVAGPSKRGIHFFPKASRSKIKALAAVLADPDSDLWGQFFYWNDPAA